ncbi:MAG: hypothetical protein IKU22_08780 [Alistipes sp.]|nr:hypothetical protein [Alistipes sp.]
MATILEALKGVNAYPVPLRTLVENAERRGLDLSAEATKELLNGADYNLVVADLLLWLSFAPDISQGGQSFSFSDEQRVQLRNRANALYKEFDATEAGTPKPIYGYKGNRL